MSRRKTRAEDIRNPEHYFNRMVALEHLRDEQDTAKYIKQFPSLEAMIESGNEGPGHNSVMLLAVNENGEEFDRYITHASMLGWFEVIDNETLYQAISSLSYEDKLLLTFRYQMNLSQAESAALLGITQSQVSRRESKLKKHLREFFKKPHRKG